MRIPLRCYRSLLCGGIVGLAAFGFGWFVCQRLAPGNQARAQAPNRPPADSSEPSENKDRIVAYIYGTTAITREELGEYLIARYGADKLDLLINKRIIEHACAEKHIQVTDAEVEADLEETTKGIHVSRKEFLEKVLKERHLTLYEWKEDVVRPKLLLTKLARERIRIEDQEIKDAFDAEYGEKIDCQIIHFPPGHPAIPPTYYDKIRSCDAEFDSAARTQPNPNLAMYGGKCSPIGHHTTTPEVERVIFSLKPGDVSQVITSQNQGQLIVKCLGRVPPQKDVSIDKVRNQLYKQVFDKRIQQEIPLVFRDLRNQAQAKNFLSNRETQSDLVREVQQELRDSDKLLNSPRRK